MACRYQARHDDGAHGAQTYESDLHKGYMKKAWPQINAD
jgi:hypothetical protein